MDKISWIDSKGNELQLEVLRGMNGRFMPPIAFQEEEVAFQAGSRLRNIKVKPRDVDIPLLIQGETDIDLRQQIRDILRRFNPLNGDGKLKVFSPDGSQRELYCRYTKGLEGNEGRDSKGYNWATVVLVFRAFDPFWYDAASIVQTFKLNENPGTFFPILPLRLASSTVFADITIDNTGDVKTWPEWIVSGPGENIVLKNLSTSETLSLDISLETGETITIDTSPYKKTVTKSDGTNLFYTISDDSSLWALTEGNNSIQIQMANATSDSSIQLSYRNCYWGP